LEEKGIRESGWKEMKVQKNGHEGAFAFQGERGRKEEGNDDRADWKRNTEERK
jgi:hypothetical protein